MDGFLQIYFHKTKVPAVRKNIVTAMYTSETGSPLTFVSYVYGLFVVVKNRIRILQYLKSSERNLYLIICSV